MKHLKIIFVCAIVLLMTGCWNYRSLEELAIVGAIGIDVDNDGFNISVEIINPKKVGGTSSSGNTPEETDIVVYKVKAKTVR
jgi:spore germination protein KC